MILKELVELDVSGNQLRSFGLSEKEFPKLAKLNLCTFVLI